MSAFENSEGIPEQEEEDETILTYSQSRRIEADQHRVDAAVRTIVRFMRMTAAKLKREAAHLTVEEYIENKINIETKGSDGEPDEARNEETVVPIVCKTRHDEEVELKKDKEATAVDLNDISSFVGVDHEVASRGHILDESYGECESEPRMDKQGGDIEGKQKCVSTELMVGSESVEGPLNKEELEVLDAENRKGWTLSPAIADKMNRDEEETSRHNHLGIREENESKIERMSSSGGNKVLPMKPSHGCQAGDSSFEDPSSFPQKDCEGREQPQVKYMEVQKQAQEGIVVITATILPMGFKICKTLFVTKFLPGMTAIGDGERSEVQQMRKEEDGKRAGDSSVGLKKEGWVLIAKDIFEALGATMGIHPQSFHIYKGQQRVRFVDAVFLERDLYAEDSATSSEPLWIDVQFPESVDIPDHLVTITPEEVLVRCVFVHPKPLDIPVLVVAEGKRRGLTHEEVIKQMYVQAEERNELPWTTIAVVHDGTGTDKPFLGGYAIKKDKSKVFLHASTQLFMKGLNYSTQVGHQSSAGVEQRSRRTQTWGIPRSCQTRRECCVMTPCKELVVDHSRDFIVVARPYFYSHQLHTLQVEKTIILQKFYRQWKARKIRRQLEMEDAEKQRRAEARQLAEEAAKVETDNREQRRRDDPRTKEDFDRLKQELMGWVNSENRKIVQNKELSDEKKRAALLALNHQELKMLQDLEDRRRIITLMEKDRKFAKMFQTMSAPKLWGDVEVRTPETERAAELRALYLHLTGTSHLSTRGRLDVLLHIKWTVKEFSYHALTQELCQLIDREADLLHRGRRVASLSGLRCRIEKLFKRFIEDPEFNPGMAEYTKTAVGRMKARKLYGTVYDEKSRMTLDSALQDALRRRNPVSVVGSSRGDQPQRTVANNCRRNDNRGTSEGGLMKVDGGSDHEHNNKNSNEKEKSCTTLATVVSASMET